MSLSNRYLILITTILLFPGIGRANTQDSIRVSLQDARRIAVENNANIRNSALDMEIA